MLPLSNNSDVKQLIKIKHILNHSISFEKIKSTQNCTQCHRCQRFWHASANCSMIPRCVKLLEQHLTSECTNINIIKKPIVDVVTGITSYTTETVPPCINCGAEGNPTNYKHCEARIKYLQNIHNEKDKFVLSKMKEKSFKIQQ